MIPSPKKVVTIKDISHLFILKNNSRSPPKLKKGCRVSIGFLAEKSHYASGPRNRISGDLVNIDQDLPNGLLIWIPITSADLSAA